VWSHLTSLLAALYLYVWNSVSQPNGVDEERYVAARSSVIDTLAKARGSISVKDVDEEDAWEGWEEVAAGDVDNAALVINRHGWLESDWAKGIEGLIRRDADEEDVAKGRRVKERADPEAGRARRGDVMFQEKYDYLSERKRKAYAAWKEGILKRIREMEANGAMEIDS
jgi:origin recognition complex subunit 6